MIELLLNLLTAISLSIGASLIIVGLILLWVLLKADKPKPTIHECPDFWCAVNERRDR